MKKLVFGIFFLTCYLHADIDWAFKCQEMKNNISSKAQSNLSSGCSYLWSEVFADAFYNSCVSQGQSMEQACKNNSASCNQNCGKRTTSSGS